MVIKIRKWLPGEASGGSRTYKKGAKGDFLMQWKVQYYVLGGNYRGAHNLSETH